MLNLLKPGEPLWITEGCSDCWAMLSAGHKAIAIPSATLLTKRDVEQLSIALFNYQLNFHMYPDRDAPGERLFLQLQQLLPNLVHHQLPPDCKDFSDYYLRTHKPAFCNNPPLSGNNPALFNNPSLRNNGGLFFMNNFLKKKVAKIFA